MVLRMVVNLSLPNRDNMLLNSDNPFSNPPESDYSVGINTETWLKIQQQNCSLLNHICMPVLLFY